MSTFLTDTLLWTGALLVLVLLIRRPVAALFGAGAAYALWALPMARLLLPPIVLPAWLAPAPDPMPLGASVPVLDPMALHTGTPASFDWSALLIALWLAGAAVFLVRRFALYFRMRRELLAEARPVGEAGCVRLVETPAADGPVAFGVFDKVVALPPNFMGSRDRAARDLALAHELAHHRGHDLLCNMLVQPLFALHWFNPLARLGWQALRRDQEAACDARVMARAPREARAAYAAVIARFALQPRGASRLALAAPMACPVLGDRSIVHRLKGLAMTDFSARRRWSGRALLGFAGLALPLTGSISYAYAEPAPPAPPAVAQPPKVSVVTVDKDGERREVRIERRIERSTERKDGKEVRTEKRVYLKDGREMSAEESAAFEKEMGELRTELHRELGPNGELHRELDREMQAVQRELRAELGRDGEMQREIRVAVAEAHRSGPHARAVAHAAPRVTVACRDGQREVSEHTTDADGREHIFVCSALATAEARRAMGLARLAIERTRGLSERERAEAMRALDEAERETRAH
ncbi:M56 family metallopeptidase [Qipengyuania sediminis]|uniref:M56 family metallopeptidase n=1 Tax=Qipengyuania sediminis TaxID=1532023 RepID=UPI001059BC1C|nr:M56 family metallopeptidase [Qipengyuania sediminis]